MDDQMFNDFLTGKWKKIAYVKNTYFFMIYVDYR